MEEPKVEIVPVPVKLEEHEEDSDDTTESNESSHCQDHGDEASESSTHAQIAGCTNREEDKGSSAVDLTFCQKEQTHIEDQPTKDNNQPPINEKSKPPNSSEIIKQGTAFSDSFSPPMCGPNSLEAFMGNPHIMHALAAFGLIGGTDSGTIGIPGAGGTELQAAYSTPRRGRTKRPAAFECDSTQSKLALKQGSPTDVNDNGTKPSSMPDDKANNDDLLYCSFCDYSTKLKGTLKIHMMKHAASKQFTCTECSYTTSRSSDLKKHFRIHTGEKPFKCEECDYRSTELGALRKHMLTHSCDNPHCCPHCDYVSPRIGDLKRHMHIHSDKKPHACQHCDYKAAQLQHLRKHMLIHTGIKPYQCTYCEYRCREPRNLKTHIQTHTGDRPYSCPHCQYKAGRLGTLRRHITSIHPPNEPVTIPSASRHFLAGSDDQEEDEEEEDDDEGHETS